MERFLICAVSLCVLSACACPCCPSPVPVLCSGTGLGVTVADSAKGVKVTAVTKGSAAEIGGFRVGDLVDKVTHTRLAVYYQRIFSVLSVCVACVCVYIMCVCVCVCVCLRVCVYT